MSVRDILKEALWGSTVTPMGQEPEAESADVALRLLNRMMTRWVVSMDLLDWSDVEIGDEFPLDAEYRDHVTVNLTEKISAFYSLGAKDPFAAEQLYNEFRSNHSSAPTASDLSDMLNLPSQSDGFAYQSTSS